MYLLRPQLSHCLAFIIIGCCLMYTQFSSLLLAILSALCQPKLVACNRVCCWAQRKTNLPLMQVVTPPVPPPAQSPAPIPAPTVAAPTVFVPTGATPSPVPGIVAGLQTAPTPGPSVEQLASILVSHEAGYFRETVPKISDALLKNVKKNVNCLQARYNLTGPDLASGNETVQRMVLSAMRNTLVPAEVTSVQLLSLTPITAAGECTSSGLCYFNEPAVPEVLALRLLACILKERVYYRPKAPGGLEQRPGYLLDQYDIGACPWPRPSTQQFRHRDDIRPAAWSSRWAASQTFSPQVTTATYSAGLLIYVLKSLLQACRMCSRHYRRLGSRTR